MMHREGPNVFFEIQEQREFKVPPVLTEVAAVDIALVRKEDAKRISQKIVAEVSASRTGLPFVTIINRISGAWQLDAFADEIIQLCPEEALSREIARMSET